MNGYRICALALFLLPASVISASALPFGVTNLVSDDTSIHPALSQDPNLVNPWGLVTTGTSPFWVGDNGTGVSTLYPVNATTGALGTNPLVVPIPGDGSVTGLAVNTGANAATNFHNDTFLFVNEDGTISGRTTGTSTEVFQLASTANVYKGTTLASIGTNSYLYSANFKAGTIDVLKGNAGAPDLAGNFTDPNLPSGYAPFNVKLINGHLYVTYALQDAAKEDEVSGAGHGFVDEFDLNGNFVARIASAGTLDSPWGLAVAPASFSAFAGDLLVGNFGDGRINVFDISTNAFKGQLLGSDGAPLAIDGLWALTVGGGASNGGLSSRVYFTAGPDNETHGIFGVIGTVPEPASIAMFGFALAFLGFMSRQRLSGARV